MVSDEQRALALGVQSAIFRLVGTIPGPLVFGAIIDTSCLLWQDECGSRGNCWIYDNDGLSRNALSLAFPCMAVSAVCFLLSWITYPKKQSEEGKDLDQVKQDTRNASLERDSKESSPDESLDQLNDRKTTVIVKTSDSGNNNNGRRSFQRMESTGSEDILLDKRVSRE